MDEKNRILDYYKLNNEQKRKIYKKARETAIKYDSFKTLTNKILYTNAKRMVVIWLITPHVEFFIVF